MSTSFNYGWNAQKEEQIVMALGDGKAAVVEAPGLVISGGDSEEPPTDTVVIPEDLSANESNQSISLTIGESAVEESGIKTTEQEAAAAIAAVADPPPAIVNGLVKRYQLWHDKMISATDEAMVESAVEAIGRINKEAALHGIDIKAEIARAGQAAAGAGAAKLATGGKAKKSGGGGKAKTPRSVIEKEAASSKAAKLATAAQERPVAGTGAAGATRVKTERVLRPCLDGCGAMVPGKFQMGHDAKLKSLLLKIERGEEPLEAVPVIAQGIVKFKKGEMETLKNSQGQTTGTRQLFTLLAAPVKFHGRPEIKTTDRE